MTTIAVRAGNPDEFFTAMQQERLADLMSQWRASRDAGNNFPDELQRELDALAADELRASASRTAAALAALRS